jgi:hypothetical protein
MNRTLKRYSTKQRSLSAVITAALLCSIFAAAPAVAIDTNPKIDGGGGTTAAPAPADEIPTFDKDLEATQWHHEALNAPSDGAGKGSGVVVAVLSDGVWAGHPDLQGRVLPGYNALTKKTLAVTTDRDYSSSDAYAGTFAAALIAGTADSQGVRGIAPDAMILPVIVDGTKPGSDQSIADAITWAAANGADVIVYAAAAGAVFVDGVENVTCAAITAARANGVITFAPAGSDYSMLTPSFIMARCSDVVTVAPLSTTLSEANGFSPLVTPTLSAPGAQIVSAYATMDWLRYTTNDLADWAAALAAGAFAAAIGDHRNASSQEILDAFIKSAVDLDGPGRDARTGAGIIDLEAALRLLGGLSSSPRSAVELRAELAGKIPPSIQSVTVDPVGKTGLTWSPATDFAVTGYKVNTHNFINGRWAVKSDDFPASAVRAVVDGEVDENTYFTVTAISSTGELTSAPTNVYTIEVFEAPAPEDAEITSVKAVWNDRGIVVDVTTNDSGIGVNWYVTVIDGWTTQPLYERKVTSGNSTLVRLNNDAEARKGPLFVLATINGEKVYTPLLPEYLIEIKALAAGTNHAAVSGSTFYACTPDLNIIEGCEGATVRIVNAATGKTIAKSIVLSDMSFAVVFPWKSKNLKVYAVIDGATPIKSVVQTRVLVYRK